MVRLNPFDCNVLPRGEEEWQATFRCQVLGRASLPKPIARHPSELGLSLAGRVACSAVMTADPLDAPEIKNQPQEANPRGPAPPAQKRFGAPGESGDGEQRGVRRRRAPPPPQ